jgi:signal-transduction protein with cAMP-binding, CBS, and nucleotidyltransferase domain
MTIVRNILMEKGARLWIISPETPVLDAINLMFEKNLPALVIVEDDEVAGIFSERDIARKLSLVDETSRDMVVREYMTPAVMTVRPDQSIDECSGYMVALRIRHMPVVQGRHVIGVISLEDVMNAVQSERDMMIKKMGSFSSSFERPGQLMPKLRNCG